MKDYTGEVHALSYGGIDVERVVITVKCRVREMSNLRIKRSRKRFRKI